MGPKFYLFLKKKLANSADFLKIVNFFFIEFIADFIDFHLATLIFLLIFLFFFQKVTDFLIFFLRFFWEGRVQSYRTQLSHKF